MKLDEIVNTPDLFMKISFKAQRAAAQMLGYKIHSKIVSYERYNPYSFDQTYYSWPTSSIGTAQNTIIGYVPIMTTASQTTIQNDTDTGIYYSSDSSALFHPVVGTAAPAYTYVTSIQPSITLRGAVGMINDIPIRYFYKDGLVAFTTGLFGLHI